MSQTATIFARKVLLGGILLLSGCRSLVTSSVPSIEFSQVPRADEGGPDKLERIAGRVKNAQPTQQIVLYAKSGALWWVQPLADQPFTAIERDSTWKNDTHLGTEYGALLVKSGYRVPVTTEMLPVVGGDVVAVAVIRGDTSSSTVAKTLHFSGYEWKIRTAGSDRGGTRNAYDAANAWTDEKGFLHLRIAQRGEQWTCAEIQLTRSLGYGSYQFVVQDLSHLEPAAVLSMFTWDDLGADQNHRELDIEITRWGDPTNKNTQFTVQPYYVPANVTRFAAPSGVLTHSFRWEPKRVTFRTTKGNGRPTRVVAEQVFSSGIPAPGAETIHLNLYIFSAGKQPMQQEAEVVIEKFEYLP